MILLMATKSGDKTSPWITYDEEGRTTLQVQDAREFQTTRQAEEYAEALAAAAGANWSIERSNETPPIVIVFIGPKPNSVEQFKPIIRLLIRVDTKTKELSVNRKAKASGLRFGLEHIF